MAGHTKRHERKSPSCGPNFKLETPRLHSRTAFDRLETTTTKFPTISVVVWHQPPETSNNHRKLSNTYNDFAVKTKQTTKEIEKKAIK